MSWPQDWPTVTVRADYGPPGPDGVVPQGTLRFEPRPSRVPSGEHGVILIGSVNETVNATGGVVAVLAADLVWKVTEDFAGQPIRSFNISLPASGGDVDLLDFPYYEPLPPDYVVITGPSGGGGGGHGGELLAANNLSDLTDDAAARGHLGLGSAAQSAASAFDSSGAAATAQTAAAADATAKVAAEVTRADGAYLVKGSNLGDLPDKAAARTALGLGSAALVASGAFDAAGAATAAQAAAATDATGKVSAEASRADGAYLSKGGDLGDLPDKPGARANLGLGTAAVAAASSFDAAGAAAAAQAAAATDATAKVAAEASRANAAYDGIGAAATALGAAQSYAASADVTTLAGAEAYTDMLARRLYPWVFDLVQYGGAKGDGRFFGGVNVTASNATVSSSGQFVPADAGRHVAIVKAGPLYVTTHVTVVDHYVDANTLVLVDAPPTSGTNLVAWLASDDTAKVQKCIDDGFAFAKTSVTGKAAPRYFEVTVPPALFGIAGPLVNDGLTLGNGQLTGPVYNPQLPRITGRMVGPGGGATTQHWDNLDGSTAPAALVSFGIFQTKADQGNSVDHGNPAVFGGPAQAYGYGQVVAGEARTNGLAMEFEGFQIVVPHSTKGWAYCGLDLSGMPTAVIRDFGVTTMGSTSRGDFGNPSLLLEGYSFGILLPANGNNDLTVLDNITVAGFPRAFGLTEHTQAGRLAAIGCGQAAWIIGSYYGSAGAVHGIKVASFSAENVHTHVYFNGGGSGGIGPFVDIDQMSVETGQFYVDASDANSALTPKGKIRVEGSFTPSGLTLAAGGCGVLLEDGTNPSQSITVNTDYTATGFDRTVRVDSTAAPRTITMPSADRNPTVYTIKNVGTNTVTVAAASGQFIDTVASVPLAPMAAITLSSFGSNWDVL